MPYLTIAHILHGPILANVDIQSLRLVVHSAHAVGLEHAVLLGEILLGERLTSDQHGLFAACSTRAGEGVERACRCAAGTPLRWSVKATYSLVVRVAERLAHQLGGPVFALAVLGLQTGDYERHACGVCCSKTAVSKKSSSSSSAENRGV